MLCDPCPTGPIETANDYKSCDLEPFDVKLFQGFKPGYPASMRQPASPPLSIQFMVEAIEKIGALERTKPTTRRLSRSFR
jgi:hypothetical protein